MDELNAVFVRSMMRSKHRYAGYLLACIVAVSTFLSFGFFVTHPDLRTLVAKDYAGVIVQLLLLGQLGVALFAVFFVIFFHRFLIRLRGKEFGLLATLGISTRQLGRIVRLESAIIAGSAIILGFFIALGETYALFRLLGWLIGIPPLVTSYSLIAVAYGLAFFVTLFSVDAWLVGRMVRATTPKQMLVAGRTSQRVVQTSWIKATAGGACLAMGYIMALGFGKSPVSLQAALILPTACLVAFGTYLLFRELLIGALSAVRQRTRSGLILLSSSRLAHRVRDFALVLTVVSVLSAGVLGLMGVAFGVLDHLGQLAKSPEDHRQMLRLFALLLFVFFFLAALFLIAATTTLYVKLFTQLDEDRGQFAGLQRIGVSPKGVRKMLGRELALLFLMPALVASIHATVAMGEFTTKIAPPGLSQTGTWTSFAWIVVVFLMLFLSYFLFARNRYQHALG